MAERQFGPYRLVRQIAVGGMAEIHLAKTKGIEGFEKYVALKMIHPNFAEDEQFIQMLVDEAKIAVQLTHGNIAQTFDLGRVGDTYYITMEYVDGSDLYKLLRKASESDIEMPLDICAFVGKEVASALDHAHRKRDHTGQPLQIVHRDVSPQNVLVSYAGEVKLVDFGIAKATSKARQTAAGVIKGKYYYMSPEQAWGDRIDFRSDIFSAGIVLYEMITGQMLYLEEDLHKLLDMARKADIAPPSRLRKGVPPQLERIVMHALHKVPGERYQSAGDFATDLERFLHAYAPVFTASKLSGMLRSVIGEPMQVVDEDPEIEVRGGPLSTHPLDQSQFAHHPDEIRDENSVIFRPDALPQEPQAPVAARAPTKPTAPMALKAAPAPAPKPAPVAKPAPQARIPSVARKAQDVSNLPQLGDRPPARGVAKLPSRQAPAVKPRQLDEETRELTAPPPGPGDDLSGLLLPPRRAAPKPNTPAWDHSETHPGDPDPGEETNDEDLENVGERTMITAPGFLAGAPAAEEEDPSDEVDYGGVDATMITASPPNRPESDTDVHAHSAPDDGQDHADDDGPTISRDFREKRAPAVRKVAQPPPAALAAKIQAPAVSELRKPRASRRTPPDGVPAQSALQAIVGAQSSAPMPAPRAPRPATQPPPLPPQATQPPQPQQPAPQAQPQPPPQQPYYQQPYEQPPQQSYAPQTGYMADASGMPMGIPTPPTGVPAYQGQPYGQPYPQPSYNQYPTQNEYGQAPINPAAMYGQNPYGQRPQPLSLTGQLRLSEVDELPSQYKLGSKKTSWIVPVLLALVALGTAAGITFFLVRSSHDNAPVMSSVRVESTPSGADVVFDGKLVGKTPMTVDQLEAGSSHALRVALEKYKPYEEKLEMPRNGTELTIQRQLSPITGKLVISTTPKGAEVLLNGQSRGRTPLTLTDVDVSSAKKLELRLKDYEPIVRELQWPEDGQLLVDVSLKRP